VSELPPDYEWARHGRVEIAAQRGAGAPVAALLRAWAGGTLDGGRPLSGGRGGTRAFDLAGGLSVVLRECRRGGLVARFNRDLYFGRRLRPFEELRVTARLHAAGVPVAETLGAAVRWVVPGCYRGAVVTREIPDAINLWTYLRQAAPAEREPACTAAARATRRLHDAGAVHPDLNLENYLVRTGATGPEAIIIDCDRVRLGGVSARDRQAAFDRLCRSIRRCDPTSAVITLACVEALHAIATGAAVPGEGRV
jgi:3-deoxy-D-manno-octulosonic acid kinase